MAATAPLEIPIYAKYQRGLIHIGTVRVDCDVKTDGRIIAPSSDDFIDALKNIEVNDG